MVKQLHLMTLLGAAVAVSAFAPSRNSPLQPSVWGVSQTASSSRISQLYAEGEKAAKNEIFYDEDFDNVPLVRLLGLRRMKKKIRKANRQLNERIRNFEVVLDDASGEWLPATPEQTAAMKAEANAGKPKTKPMKRKKAVRSSSSAGKAAKDPLKIIIAGAPASGKGTQCEMIKERYGVVHLSTGDMLRAAVVAQTDVGIKAKEFMDSGKLVPDEVIIGVVKDRLSEGDCKKHGWLLDGFPRTPAQADALADAGVCADCFLFLNVPDSALIERVVGRRTDPVTGKIYHMTFSPPDDEEILARLEQRSDDTEEKVKVRLEQFHANVEAVKGSYTNISVEIDGSQKPGDVANIIEQKVKEMVGDKVTV